MLATPTPPTEAATPPHTINQMECFATAVAMVQNRHRARNRAYASVLYPLVDSFNNAKAAHAKRRTHPNAGGPAMRLAQALWDLDYRTLFPTDKTLIEAEENSSAHFYHYYADMAGRPFHISKAAQAFRNLRVNLVGDFPKMPENVQPHADATPSKLCLALLEMDRAVFNPVVPVSVQKNRTLTQVLGAVSSAHPQPDELLIRITQAIPDFVWFLREPTGYNFHKAREHHDPLKALQYKHRIQLQSQDTALNKAISALCRAIQPVAQA
ncbi:MAG: hypothetical protein EON60_02635 [Alphaproteobacteria bacterium]|nr:MAG: hypothetical protein EON60_02635 [Alphaproteobacteria bacterium]